MVRLFWLTRNNECGRSEKQTARKRNSEGRLVGRGSARAGRVTIRRPGRCVPPTARTEPRPTAALVPYRYSITARIACAVKDPVFGVDQDGSGMAHDVCVRLHDLDEVTSLLETSHNFRRNTRFQSYVICLGARGSTI